MKQAPVKPGYQAEIRCFRNTRVCTRPDMLHVFVAVE